MFSHCGLSLRVSCVLASLAIAALAQEAKPVPLQGQHASSSSGNIFPVTEKDHKGVINLKVGQILKVVLSADPISGYVWRPPVYPTGVLRPHGDPAGVQDPTDLPVGIEVSRPVCFSFEVMKESQRFTLGFQKTSRGITKPERVFEISVSVTK